MIPRRALSLYRSFGSLFLEAPAHRSPTRLCLGPSSPSANPCPEASATSPRNKINSGIDDPADQARVRVLLRLRRSAPFARISGRAPPSGSKPSVGSRATARLEPRGRAAKGLGPSGLRPLPWRKPIGNRSSHADRLQQPSRHCTGRRLAVAPSARGSFGHRVWHAERTARRLGTCSPSADCASAIRAMLAAFAD